MLKNCINFMLVVSGLFACSGVADRWYPKKIQARGMNATVTPSAQFNDESADFNFNVSASLVNPSEGWCRNVDKNYGIPYAGEGETIMKSACETSDVTAGCLVYDTQDRSLFSTLWYPTCWRNVLKESIEPLRKSCTERKDKRIPKGNFESYLLNDNTIDLSAKRESGIKKAVSFTKKDKSFCEEFDASDMTYIAQVKNSFPADSYEMKTGNCAIDDAYARCDTPASETTITSSIFYYADSIKSKWLADIELECRAYETGAMKAAFSTSSKSFNP